jgi:aminomethyltransferase
LANELRLSPLDARHRALDAKMVPFGGWDMPLSYPTGTLDEHRACRSSGVVFDVSHLGTLRVEGREAFTRLQQAFTNDLARISPGRAQYTHLLAEDGSVVDDIIIWWLDAERFDVMPNASNTSRVDEALGPNDDGCRADDMTHTRAVLAIQGPTARETLSKVTSEAAAVGRFRVNQVVWSGVTLTVAGTGYTGEDGVEVAVPAEAAEGLWDALTDAGLVPAGLGARDTLRLEAGLPLHGQELGPGITPLQAGLDWVVRPDKGEFRGRAALEAERQTGPRRLLRGLLIEGRRPARTGATVSASGQRVGEVTSGNFSPVLERAIAMAFLDLTVGVGDEVQVQARRDVLTALVVELPFVGK